MDIDGFGTKLVDQLVNTGLIKNFSNIYELNIEKLSDLERMAEKSAQNIMNSIEKSKSTTLARFIHSLGIRNVGEHSGKVLEKSFGGKLSSLMNADVNSLKEIHEIGDIMAESIFNFFNDENKKNMIEKCLNSGIQFAKIEKNKPSKHSGKIFVFTGTLEKFSRKDAQTMVEKVGARASNSISSKTDFLIAGTGAGSKLNKSIELGITILSEDEFLQMMGENFE